jgi:hypothetical protein
MNGNFRKNVISSKLLSHLENNNYKGFDPSTIRFSPRMLKITDFLDRIQHSHYIKAIISRLTSYGGHRLLFLLNPSKVVLPKCLALAAIAYVNCARGSNDPEKITKAASLIRRLLESSLPNKMVWSHGYPYKIKETEVRVDTPNLVTTYFVANAFWQYSSYVDKKYYNLFSQIVDDSWSTFPYKKFGDFGCFMYTPESTYYVHNANLMMVEMLARNALLQKTTLPEEAKKALLFSLTDFERTGFFPYAGGPTQNFTEDNYHTGYVLRSFQSIKNTGMLYSYNSRIERVVENGLNRYLKLFVKNGYIIRDKNWTINSHSLAEAILIGQKFRELLSDMQKQELNNAIEKTIQYLGDEELVNLVSLDIDRALL